MNRGKHKSLDPKLSRERDWLQSFNEVSTVIVGRSESCRHRYSPGTLKIQSETNNGFKMNGYSGNGVTVIYCYVHHPDHKSAVRNAINHRHKSS
jgi:hypothetical protein